MADNKNLHTLTLDGVSQDVFNCKSIDAKAARPTGNVASAQSDPISVGPGRYLVRTAATAKAGSSTARRWVNKEVLVDGSSVHAMVLTNNTNEDMVMENFLYFETNASCTYACKVTQATATSRLEALVQVIQIGTDIVGGVIRTLKSLKKSICYRPLNFGKAVA